MKAPATLTAAILASTAPVALATAVLLAATPAAAQDASPAAQDAPADTDTATDTGADRRTTFDIAAQPLSSALLDYSRQSGILVVVDPARVADKRARAVKGRHSAADALNRMLVGTGLVPQRQAQGGFTLVEARGARLPGELVAARGGRNRGSLWGGDAVPEGQGGIAEILVVGSRSQNVDIRRTEDDPQPYVVFASEELKNSNAENLEQFLRNRLPMNTQQITNSQLPDLNSSNIGSVNLRGLGSNQTLILVDGRRMPRVNIGGEFSQTDINGIPIGAIERIEVLPSTAGGIYGGGAVGGVINIIRKRDYDGIDLDATYNGTFRGGGEVFRAGISGGFSPNNGQTQVSFSASHSASRPLYAGDRKFLMDGRRLFVANDPLQAPFPGGTPNIQSTNVFSFGCFCSTQPDLTLDSDFGEKSLGSTFTFIPIGYLGINETGPAELVQNAGRYNLDLSSDILGEYAPVLNNPRVRSANINVRQAIGSDVDVFYDLSIASNKGRSVFLSSTVGNISLPAAAPGNPFQQDIIVFFPVTDLGRPMINRSTTLSLTGGGVARLGGNWVSTVEYGWSRSRSITKATQFPLKGTAADAIRSGEIDILRDFEANPIDWTPDMTPCFSSKFD